jgi:drug/metabolite transporter (DMT)-like permease
MSQAQSSEREKTTARTNSERTALRTGLICIVIATFMFSSMEVAIKLTSGHFNPIQLNMLRFFVGGLILLPFARKRLKEKHYSLAKRDLWSFAFMGLACTVVSMSLYTISLLYIPAYQDAILFSSNTFFGILLSMIFLRERLSPFGVTGLCIALAGMLFIVDPLHFSGSATGVILVLLSAFTFAIYSVFSKYLTAGRPTGGLVITCGAFFFGCAELLVCVALSHIPAVSGLLNAHGLSVLADIPIFTGITSGTILLLAYISVLVTGVGFATYFTAIEMLGVSTSTLVFFIKPVISPIFAFLVLGEVISASNMIGLAIIALGSSILFISNVSRR